MNDRTHFRPEDVALHCPFQQIVKAGNRLQQLHTAALLRQPLIHLQKRHYASFFPQIVRSKQSVNLPVHGVFEQDGPQDIFCVEGRAFDNTRPHSMHQRIHFLIAGITAGFDAVLLQCLWGASSALIQCCNESFACANPFQLRLVHVRCSSL
ncbi:hypothetical protein D3C75_938280 [compost metagenome]